MKTHISDPHGGPLVAPARIFDRRQPRKRRKKTLFSLFAPVLFAGLGLLPAGRATAQLTVTSTADSGAGTLRAALASAANGDTIDATGVSGTILLTSGELLVPNSVTILGPGPANLAVDGNAAGRVFHVSGAVVTIAGLTITNGRASGSSPANSGGGIFTGPGTLTVSNCSLSGNSASALGGGIYNNGAFGSATLTLSACTLSGSSANAWGGGIYNDGAFGSATVTVSNSTLTGNSASTTAVASAGGGGIYNDGAFGNATLTLSGCTFSGNSANTNNVASGLGGGIYSDGSFGGSATLTLSASTLSGNSANTIGGGIYNGGYNGSATLTVSNSTLNGNLARTIGAGIYNDGYNGSATLTVSASTLSSNSAINIGGGIYNTGASSGTGIVQIANSTFSGNSAGDGSGGGIYNNGGGGSATVELGSTILKAGAVGANIANFSGTVSSDGYNLASDNGGGFLTGMADQINTDPMLGPLQDNGGPTFTHALLPGSPAIDKGKNLSGSATDQRGLPRTVDIPSIPNAVGSDGTDIGAVEFQAPLLSNPSVGAGQYGFTLTGEPNQPVVVEASTNLVSWTALATNTLGVSPLHFNDPAWTNFQQRFYRARLAP